MCNSPKVNIKLCVLYPRAVVIILAVSFIFTLAAGLAQLLEEQLSHPFCAGRKHCGHPRMRAKGVDKKIKHKIESDLFKQWKLIRSFENCNSGGHLLSTANLRACRLLADSGEVVSNVEILNSYLEGMLYRELCQQASHPLNICHEISLVHNLYHCSNISLWVNRHTLNVSLTC